MKSPLSEQEKLYGDYSIKYKKAEKIISEYFRK